MSVASSASSTIFVASWLDSLHGSRRSRNISADDSDRRLEKKVLKKLFSCRRIVFPIKLVMKTWLASTRRFLSPSLFWHSLSCHLSMRD